LAPLSIKSLAISTLPLIHAMCKGVLIFLALGSTSPLFSNTISAIFKWPSLAATCKVVQSSLLCELTSALNIPYFSLFIISATDYVLPVSAAFNKY
jgi:hypothetical protein